MNSTTNTNYLSGLKQHRILPYIGLPEADEYMISWFITRVCNFKCEYCYLPDIFRSDLINKRMEYSPQHIASSFDNTGKKFRILLVGGEPFLHPNFIALCGLLTKKHRIGISTNLSTSNAYEFAERIDPARVFGIYASLHLYEREKINNGVVNFINLVKHFQNKGFSIRVEYVAYPSSLPRIKQDVRFLKENGIEAVDVKIFRGEFNNKLYPASYNVEERSLIYELAENQFEIDILQGRNCFFGNICAAGQKFFHMDEAGNLTRCLSSKKSYGNLFEGTYVFEEKPKLCSSLVCKCPYEGITFGAARKGKLFFASLVQFLLSSRNR